MIRKAVEEDIKRVAEIYNEIHTEDEAGRSCAMWIRGVYPTIKTAEDAYKRGDLFVEEDEEGFVIGAAIINQIQVKGSYELAPWSNDVADERVMVLHTLVISPSVKSKGWGRKFIAFYENYAKENGCSELRMDTNEKNIKARALYQSLGYKEVAVVPTVFNGIPNVNLVLIEKSI